MSRYTKTQVTQLSANEQAAINNINKNFDDIETAIKDTVSRSGNTPTHMTEDLDMNGKRIINLPAPKTDTDPVRRQDIVGDIALVQSLVNATTNAAAQTLEAAASVQEIIQDANVGLVADDLALDENSKIRLCGTNIESITDVADDIDNINTVLGELNDISTVSSNIGTISSVADNIAPIGINASQITAITTNADNIGAIEYNYDNRRNINSVAENGENIEDVANNLSAITACAADLPNINSKANISLNNLNATGEARFNNKVNLNGDNATFVHITETYSNGKSWYRIYSDGWCEQGGDFGEAYTSYTQKTITLLKTFANTNYHVLCNSAKSGNSYVASLTGKTTSTFSLYNTLNYNALSSWSAYGYIT